jgi:hypothetical protein
METCDKCKVVHSNGDSHICVEYDDSKPCDICGAGTVFVMIGAPGYGQGRECRNGHYDGTHGELSLADVI